MLNQDKHVYSFMCFENYTYIHMNSMHHFTPHIFILHENPFCPFKNLKGFVVSFLVYLLFSSDKFFNKKLQILCVAVALYQFFILLFNLSKNCLSVSVVALLLSDPLLPASSLDKEDKMIVASCKENGWERKCMQWKITDELFWSTVFLDFFSNKNYVNS